MKNNNWLWNPINGAYCEPTNSEEGINNTMSMEGGNEPFFMAGSDIEVEVQDFVETVISIMRVENNCNIVINNDLINFNFNPTNSNAVEINDTNKIKTKENKMVDLKSQKCISNEENLTRKNRDSNINSIKNENTISNKINQDKEVLNLKKIINEFMTKEKQSDRTTVDFTNFKLFHNEISDNNICLHYILLSKFDAELFNFNDEAKKIAAKNILKFLIYCNHQIYGFLSIENQKMLHDAVILFLYENFNRNEIKKALLLNKRKFSGSINIENQILTVEKEFDNIEISVRDDLSGRQNGTLKLDLFDLNLKEDTVDVIAYLKVNGCIKKKVNLKVSYIRNEYDFLNTNFTDWCMKKCNHKFDDIYYELVLYSICSKIDIKILSKNFIELQIKMFMGYSRIDNEILSHNISYYNCMFKDISDIIGFLKMLMSWLETQFLEICVPYKLINSFLKLYEFINMILLNLKRKDSCNNVSQKKYFDLHNQNIVTLENKKREKNEQVDIKDSLSKLNLNVEKNNLKLQLSKNNQFYEENSHVEHRKKMMKNLDQKSVLLNNLRINFTTTLLSSIEKKFVVTFLKNLNHEILNVWRNKYEQLLDHVTLSKCINKMLYRNVLDQKYIFQIITYLQSINSILGKNVVDDRSFPIIKYWLSQNIEMIFNLFLDTISIVLKNVEDETITETEIHYSFRALMFYLKNISQITIFNIFEEVNNTEFSFKKKFYEFVLNFNNILNHNFKRMHRKCKKGIDKKKLQIFKFNRSCLNNLNEIAETLNINIEVYRVEYMCKEYEEIEKMIKYNIDKVKTIFNEEGNILPFTARLIEKTNLNDSVIVYSIQSKIYNDLIDAMKDDFEIEKLREIGFCFLK